MLNALIRLFVRSRFIIMFLLLLIASSLYSGMLIGTYLNNKPETCRITMDDAKLYLNGEIVSLDILRLNIDARRHRVCRMPFASYEVQFRGNWNMKRYWDLANVLGECGVNHFDILVEKHLEDRATITVHPGQLINFLYVSGNSLVHFRESPLAVRSNSSGMVNCIWIRIGDEIEVLGEKYRSPKDLPSAITKSDTVFFVEATDQAEIMKVVSVLAFLQKSKTKNSELRLDVP